MLDRNPALKARVGDATNLGKPRMTDDLTAYYRRSCGPGWALAGDAGHFKDPVTGNGMRDALKFGRLLGEAVVPFPARQDPARRGPAEVGGGPRRGHHLHLPLG
jgi:2-polyprenyl-6-methoxyphenol hydroxylase-like FAD-dependent oxidoreductase